MQTTFFPVDRRLTDSEWLQLKALRRVHPEWAWRYGDPHPDNLLNDGTQPNFVFLQYQRECRNGERWVKAEQFEAYREQKLDRSSPPTPASPTCDPFFQAKPALHGIRTQRKRAAHRRRVRREDQIATEKQVKEMLTKAAAAPLGGMDAVLASDTSPIVALDATRRRITRGEWLLLQAWLAADPDQEIEKGTFRDGDSWVFAGYHPLAKGGENWRPGVGAGTPRWAPANLSATEKADIADYLASGK